MPNRRIALYSHDTMGIGHMRRNLSLAQAFAAMPDRPSIVMLCGAREANVFDLPPGVDLVTLPAYQKCSAGHYSARSLEMPLSELVALRARTLAAALECFSPEVLIVDKVPRGVAGELDLALGHLHGRGGSGGRRPHCVLGLRDILDEPAAVRREWDAEHAEKTISAHYSAVWVYGSPSVCDVVKEYGMAPATAEKVRYVGYLNRRARPRLASAPDLLDELRFPPGRLVLCMVGGGQDGAHLAHAFAAAPLPPETNGLILTGPFMPESSRAALRNVVDATPRLGMLEFTSDTSSVLRRAERVVVMGGYNTMCEVVSNHKHALVIPRVCPRQEQWIRATRFQALGLVDVLHPDRLTPETLGDWMARPAPTRPPARDVVDFGGLERLGNLLEELAGPPCGYGAPAVEGAKRAAE
jgi:predicted glycosyltransferase